MRLLAVKNGRKKIWNIDESQLVSCQYYSGIDRNGYFLFWKCPKNWDCGDKKHYLDIDNFVDRAEFERHFVPAHWL